MFFKEFIIRSKLFALVKVLSKKEKLVLLGAAVVFLLSAITYGTLYFQAKTVSVAAEGGEFREGV
ncbi:MAG: hypothetical protein WD889_01435, partial [Candidatus Colwellbacteria bacterium]